MLTQFESYDKLEVYILKYVNYIHAQMLLRSYRFIQRIDEYTNIDILVLQIKKIKGHYSHGFVDNKCGSGMCVYARIVRKLWYFTYFESSLTWFRNQTSFHFAICVNTKGEIS